ncbi:MAG: hypothetical protein AB8B72_04745 [Crocinitomicaceae bacterium]
MLYTEKRLRLGEIYTHEASSSSRIAATSATSDIFLSEAGGSYGLGVRQYL